MCENCAFLQSFHTRELAETSVFYAVGEYLSKVSDEDIRVIPLDAVLYCQFAKGACCIDSN